MPELENNFVLRRWPMVVSILSLRIRRRIAKLTKRLISANRFGWIYSIGSFTVLVTTTVLWSYLGAQLQQSNADQLADPLLFGSKLTFNGAQFPAQHSFLLKWPIFYLIKLAGYSSLSFIIATVATATVTIVLFAGLLYRIDRRPLVFGTVYLALASCLLLVPAMPYPGGLLPVNMAMITTRNLEYIVYIFGLVYVARQPKFNSWRFWVAALSLALVCASDRLFLDITVGGALLAILAYGLRQRWKLVSLSVNWLLTGLTAAALALGALWVVDGAQMTHIVGQSNTSPYATVHSAKDLVLAVGYGASDVFTNFGANPAYDATIVRQIPPQLYHRLFSLSGISFIVNAGIMLYGLFICSRFLRAGLQIAKARTIKPSTSFRLTNLMIWTSLAAFVVFVVSDHDYAVDSRYLTICVFTVFIALTSSVSKKRLRPTRLLISAVLVCLGIIAATPQLLHAQRSGQQALAGIDSRNQLVAQAMLTHHTSTLAGDYWRVLPTKLATNKQALITPYPLASCTTARTVLTSRAWQPDLHGQRFAYLLSIDGNLTGFPACSLQQITNYYGRPNSTELIAGSLAHPTELLLFYDQGLQKPTTATTTVSTILPISLDALPHTTCPVPTIMNIVAHQDDDILFMNPDILHDIQMGHCVRTVYVTAGDAGQGRAYWLSREQGSEAAYTAMTGDKQPWVQRVVRLSNHQYITVANPRGNHQISLIFMRLPDGGLTGQGFGSTHTESLLALNNGKVESLHSVDGQSSYTAAQLVRSLSDLLVTYQPTSIHTQSDFHGTAFTDHTDHQAVGIFVSRAYANFEKQQYDGQITVPIKYYVGYPIRQLPPNLSNADHAAKQAIFLQYALFDGSVCHSADQCDQTSTYSAYLQRQYKNPN